MVIRYSLKEKVNLSLPKIEKNRKSGPNQSVSIDSEEVKARKTQKK